MEAQATKDHEDLWASQAPPENRVLMVAREEMVHLVDLVHPDLKETPGSGLDALEHLEREALMETQDP